MAVYVHVYKGDEFAFTVQFKPHSSFDIGERYDTDDYSFRITHDHGVDKDGDHIYSAKKLP